MANSVRSILASHYRSNINSISYQEKIALTQQIRAEVKAAVGHGVSQDYYDKHWSYYAINPKYINRMIIGAKFKLGAWSDENVLKGRKRKKDEEK